jgi:hypothetical protein
MANKKTKKHKPKLRNAATASAIPRSRPATRGSSPRASSARLDQDTPGWQAAKLGAGVLAGALACAFVAKQDWLPPKAITGATTAVGTALLLGGHSDTLRLMGAGAAAAAGGQLLLLAVDDQLQSKPEQVASNEKEKDKDKDKTPPKRQASLNALPPGALESAYERARRRLEMTQISDVPV